VPAVVPRPAGQDFLETIPIGGRSSGGQLNIKEQTRRIVHVPSWVRIRLIRLLGGLFEVVFQTAPCSEKEVPDCGMDVVQRMNPPPDYHQRGPLASFNIEFCASCMLCTQDNSDTKLFAPDREGNRQ
jgi:hypothetical protein